MSQIPLFSSSPSAELPEMSRRAGLAHLERFSSAAGRAYASGRNVDAGRGAHSAVSRLSGHLRRRLITEEEVLSAVLQKHSFPQAEKFVTEVFWRTYFKGWLEMRPSVFVEADSAGATVLDTADEDMQAALDGRTGIDCFDAWTSELIDTGYLHNHARMWYASIWIFTLGLDWRAGARFFMRHLRDGCPASNTLGWRWVAGLHTAGKHYLARAENISQFTNGRFNPKGQLNERALSLTAPPPPQPLELTWEHPDLRAPYGLLITAEDGHAESLPLSSSPTVIISLPARMGDSSWTGTMPSSGSATRLSLDKAAIEDASERAAAYFGCPHIDISDEHDEQAVTKTLSRLAHDYTIAQFTTAYPGVGYWQNHMHRLARELSLSESQSKLDYVSRPYDRMCYPFARKGFFAFKTHIPKWLSQMGLA